MKPEALSPERLKEWETAFAQAAPYAFGLLRARGRAGVLRRMFRSRQEALLDKAVAKGLADGILQAQRYFDGEAGVQRLSRVVVALARNEDTATLGLPLADPPGGLEQDLYPDVREWMMASERYGAGYWAGFFRLAMVRAGVGNPGIGTEISKP